MLGLFANHCAAEARQQSEHHKRLAYESHILLLARFFLSDYPHVTTGQSVREAVNMTARYPETIGLGNWI
ncbi:MAG: hypothetical protein OHK006_22800 [Thermodesulfovibrionales bacterium]